MKILLIFLTAAFSCLSFFGCNTTHYDFKTFVDEDGGVKREVELTTYDRSEYDPEAEKLKPEKERQKPPAFSEKMLIPQNMQRFDAYEIENGRWYAKWHSDGEIYTDFRYELQTPDSTILPYRAKEVRYAFNEGEVIVHDFVLVRTITYVERFHDFFTQDEMIRNVDLAIDILGEVFLKTLEKDLGGEYRLDRLNTYVRKQIQPILKRWNSVIFEAGQHKYPVVTVGFSEGNESNDNGTQEETEEPDRKKLDKPVQHILAKIMYDLLKLGVIEDLQIDTMEDDAIDGNALEALLDDIEDWGYERMSELVVSKSTGISIRKEALEEYFGERYSESFKKEAAVMFGGEEKFDDLMGFLLGTFMFKDFPFDEHKFDLTLEISGTLLSVFPMPEDTANVKALWSMPKTKGGNNYIRWRFTKLAFYPDGVILVAATAIPQKVNQKQLFKKIVLEDPEDIKEYCSLLLSLNSRQRESILKSLKRCLEKRSIESFAEEINEWNDNVHAIFEMLKRFDSDEKEDQPDDE